MTAFLDSFQALRRPAIELRGLGGSALEDLHARIGASAPKMDPTSDLTRGPLSARPRTVLRAAELALTRSVGPQPEGR